MLKDRQTTFSLEKQISKHGIDIGLENWNNRQNKWQESLNNLPDHIIKENNIKKGTDRMAYRTPLN